jgi:hypothetical protein
MMDIQKEVQEIHQKYGLSELANYKIQLLCEKYAKMRIKDLLDNLPTDQEVDQYANGNFGYESDSYDRERAFISGTEWMRDQVLQKLNGE